MKPVSSYRWRKTVKYFAWSVIFPAFAAVVWWAQRPGPPQPESLHLKFRDESAKANPYGTAAFLVTSDRDCSIFLENCESQGLSSTGWVAAPGSFRGEIRRLKAGVSQEIDFPSSEYATWRACLEYGTEVKGVGLLRFQLLEAWKLHGFSNWNGKAWGGGRWSGSYLLFSDEVHEH